MSRFEFGGVDLTDWIERVSVREEYETVSLTRGVQALGGVLGENQPAFWRIRAEGYAFGDTVAELRARLAQLRRRGVQNLRWQTDRYTRAVLTEFRVDDWQGGVLLMPNVTLEFLALPFAYGEEVSLALDYPTAAQQLVWTNNLTIGGEYETGLVIDYSFTLSASATFEFRFYWGQSVWQFRSLRWQQFLQAGAHRLLIDGEQGFAGVITPSSGSYFEFLRGLSGGRLPFWDPQSGLLQAGLWLNPLPASGTIDLRYRPKYQWL